MEKKQDWSSYLLIFGLLATLIAGCSDDDDDNDSSEASISTLTMAWETTDITAAESARYDPQRKVIFVSHEINGGGIAKIDLNGQIQELEWVTGLNGAKGIAIYGDRLYVGTKSGLVEINANDGTVVETYSDPNMKLPNDVAVDRFGNVYISDTLDNAIYRLSEGTFELWLQDDALVSPNGIYVEDDRLLVAPYGVITDLETFTTTGPVYILTVSLTDKTIGNFTNVPVGNMDGIERDENNNYFVTDWATGSISYITSSGEVSTLMTLTQGAADLGYVPDEKLLLVPWGKSVV